MIIDAHVHISPSKKPIPKNMQKASTWYMLRTGVEVTHYGTVEDLLSGTSNNEIAKVCILPIATSKSSENVTKLNNFISNIMKENSSIEGFASVHPFSDSPSDELIKAITDFGLKGLMLDPNSQKFRFSDNEIWSLLETVKNLKIPVAVHDGYLVESKDKYFEPDEVNETVISFPGVNFVFAQMPRNGSEDRISKIHPERNVFYDTSHSSAELISATVHDFGADHLVYGSDFKYNFYPHYEKEKIAKLDISEEDKEKILFKNMARILKLPQEQESRLPNFLKRFLK